MDTDISKEKDIHFTENIAAPTSEKSNDIECNARITPGFVSVDKVTPKSSPVDTKTATSDIPIGSEIDSCCIPIDTEITLGCYSMDAEVTLNCGAEICTNSSKSITDLNIISTEEIVSLSNKSEVMSTILTVEGQDDIAVCRNVSHEDEVMSTTEFITDSNNKTFVNKASDCDIDVHFNLQDLTKQDQYLTTQDQDVSKQNKDVTKQDKDVTKQNIQTVDSNAMTCSGDLKIQSSIFDDTLTMSSSPTNTSKQSNIPKHSINISQLETADSNNKMSDLDIILQNSTNNQITLLSQTCPVEQDKLILSTCNSFDNKSVDFEKKEQIISPQITENSTQVTNTSSQHQPQDLSLLGTVNQITQDNKAESANFPKVFVIKRRTQQIHDPSKKHGSKLASLLQRLNAEHANSSVPGKSILNTSIESVKSSSETDMIQSKPLISSLMSSINTTSNAEQVPQISFKDTSSNSTKMPVDETSPTNISKMSKKDTSPNIINVPIEDLPLSNITTTSITDGLSNIVNIPFKFKPLNLPLNTPISCVKVLTDEASKQTTLTFKLPQTKSSSLIQQNNLVAVSSNSHSSSLQVTDTPSALKEIIKNSKPTKPGPQRRRSVKLGSKDREPGLNNSDNDLTDLLLQQNKSNQNVQEPVKKTVKPRTTKKSAKGKKSDESASLGQLNESLKELPSVETAAVSKPKKPRGRPKKLSTRNILSKPSNVDTSCLKQKHQISLLKPTGSYLPISLSSVTNVPPKVSNVNSLLNNSPKKFLISPSYLEHSTSTKNPGMLITNASPALLSPVVVPDLTNSTVPSIGPNTLILASRNNMGQILFHSVPYTAVTSISSQPSVASSPVFLTLPTASNKKYKAQTIKTLLLAAAPANTNSSPVVTVPTSQTLHQPIAAILAKTITTSTECHIPVSHVTPSTTLAKTLTVKYAPLINVEPNPTGLTDPYQNCTNLILNISQNHLSHKNTDSLLTQTTLPKDKDGNSTTEKATPKMSHSDKLTACNTLKVHSILKTAPTTVQKSLVSQMSPVPQISQIVMPTKSFQTSLLPKPLTSVLTVPSTDSKPVYTPISLHNNQIKILTSCPENISPVVKTQDIQSLQPKRKQTVSLLKTTSTPTQQSVAMPTDTLKNTSTTKQKSKKLKAKIAKSIDKIILNNDLITSNLIYSPNLSLKNNSQETKTSSSLKNAKQTKSLNDTPNSKLFMVVTPDNNDDLLDMKPEINLSNIDSTEESTQKSEDDFDYTQKLADLNSPEKSVTIQQSFHTKASVKDSHLPSKDVKVENLDMSCSEELEVFNENYPGNYEIIDYTGPYSFSDADISYPIYSEETEISDLTTKHTSTSFDDEETDSDVEMGSEELDMSVLQQLLKSKNSFGPQSLINRQVLSQKDINSDVVDETVNEEYQFGINVDSEEDKANWSSNNFQKKFFISREVTPHPQLSPFAKTNICGDEMKVRPNDGDCCSLKIDSIFSLNNNIDLDESEVTDVDSYQESDETFPGNQSLTFNIRDSQDWKSCVSPCFVVLERLSQCQVYFMGSSDLQSKCSEHCRNRTLDYLCNLNLLKCVNHPDVSLFSKPKIRSSMIRNKRRKVKYEIIKEDKSFNEIEICSQFPMLEGLKQDLPPDIHHKPALDDIHIDNDTKLPLRISKTEHYEFRKDISFESVGQCSKRTDNSMCPRLDLFSTINELHKFLRGLKQLRRQVCIKRNQMAQQKLLKSKNCEMPIKYHTKLAKKKSASKRFEVSSKKVKYIAANRTKPTKMLIIGNHILPSKHTKKRIRRISGSQPFLQFKNKTLPANLLLPFIKKYSVHKNVAAEAPASSKSNVANSAPKVPIPKLVTTNPNVVSIQPKVLQPPAPPAPPAPDKVKAALESLNSYLESTGRKPTADNTQYILLKIDDQHILVKLPLKTATNTSPSNVAVKTTAALLPVNVDPLGDMIKNSPKGGQISMTSQESVSGHLHQLQPSTESDKTKSVSNHPTVTKKNFIINALPNMQDTVKLVSSMNSSATTSTLTNMNRSLITLANSSNMTPLNLQITSTNSPLMSNRGNQTSNITEKQTNVLNTTSTSSAMTKPPKRKYTRSAKNTKSVSISSKNTSSPEKSSKNVPANIDPSNVTNGSSGCTTSNSSKHPAVISLLKSGIPFQTQLNLSGNFKINRLTNVGAVVMPSVASNISSSALPSNISSSALPSNPIQEESSSSTLTNLPPNSSLLPERKKRSAVLSREARQHKRRKLETKYPLPPGLVIKAEPDDVGYELSTAENPETSSTSSLPVVDTEDTLATEPSRMYRQDRTWSAPDTDYTQTFLPMTTDQEYNTHNLGRNSLTQKNTVPYSSADMEEIIPIDPYANMENSSDELDEPPALIQERAAGYVCNTQEDMPPVLQPMFTSSYSSLVDNENNLEVDLSNISNTKPATNITSPCGTKHLMADKKPKAAEKSTSDTSLCSDSSMDSGIDHHFPSNSSSHTSVRNSTTSTTEKPVSKNLKIQHLKELLKKKEMELENMKKMRTEFPSLDLDNI